MQNLLYSITTLNQILHVIRKKREKLFFHAYCNLKYDLVLEQDCLNCSQKAVSRLKPVQWTEKFFGLLNFQFSSQNMYRIESCIPAVSGSQPLYYIHISFHKNLPMASTLDYLIIAQYGISAQGRVFFQK